MSQYCSVPICVLVDDHRSPDRRGVADAVLLPRHVLSHRCELLGPPWEGARPGDHQAPNRSSTRMASAQVSTRLLTPVKMVNFDIETANADQLMNEIIRISLHEYNILGEKIAQPIPKGQEEELVDEMVDKYIVNERLLNAYFRKLKRLLKNKPPGPQELEKKEREIDDLMKKNGLA